MSVIHINMQELQERTEKILHDCVNKMYQTIMENYGTEDGSLASAIENYLVTVCKVKKEEIGA